MSRFEYTSYCAFVFAEAGGGEGRGARLLAALQRKIFYMFIHKRQIDCKRNDL